DRYCERCQYETPITLDIDIRDTVCKASEDEENNIANYHDYYRHHCYISKKDEFNNMTWYELVRGEKRPMNDKDI
ncbi:transposase, partial [Desulfovibrio desulfuricans]|nr:transposase [Desulfovibrio desulfuricans]